MNELQNLHDLIGHFISLCPEYAVLHEWEEDGYDIKQIVIPYSREKKYPETRILVHEDKVQIIGDNSYQSGLLDKAKKFFKSNFRNV